LSQRPPIISPSPFIVEWLGRLPRGRALDLAMGRGRHAIPLARAGHHVFGVDIDAQAVGGAMTHATAERLTIAGWCADLTRYPLPVARFDVVVVTRYLQRDLFGPIREAVVPGGIVLYETFTAAQRALGTGPTSPDHLLEPQELRRRFDGFDVLFYDEASAPEAVARIVARRASAS
jgi:tellurite methyltransferase